MKTKVFISSIKNVYVAGDLHGDYKHFRKILNVYEKQRRGSLLLFLGDYADRGSSGLEIITELNILLNDREDFVALKGNHETYRDGRPTFSPCDLVSEAQWKYTSWQKFYREIMKDFLAKLYISAVINNILFVHAGISSRIKTVKDLANRTNEKDLLWSDPSPLAGEHPNMRGAGITFGKDVTTRVLTSLGLKMIVRSHEPGKAAYGPSIDHDGKIITTNSCASYGEPWKPFILKVDTKNVKYRPIFL